MPTDLSPAEKDDKESERLLNRRPPPSRKHRERRAPRHWQRRRRIREDDPDMRESKSKLIDWTSHPPLRADRDSLRPKSETDSHVDDEIRDLDRMLRGLESLSDDDVDPSSDDFEAALKALSDPDARPSPEASRKLEDLAERMVDEMPERRLEDLAEKMSDDGYDYVAELLRGSAPGYEAIKDSPQFAASYGAVHDVAPRTGAYHGVRDVRGNPTDPTNTGWKSTDKRYFTEKDYDVIVKFASGLLKQDDWLKYGWDGGAEEAPLRAALDLAIQTANDCVYQSKIDAETYTLLLNKLGKLGYDTFSDTVLSVKAKGGSRSSSMIKKNEHYQNIVRVASELRETDPVAAMNIVKSLRSLVSSEADSVPTISDHVAADVAASEAPLPSQPREAAGPPPSSDVSVPIGVLAKLASSSHEAKLALGPYILAAKGKKDDKKKDDKTAKGVPPQFLENMKKGPPKGKGKGKGKGKKKKASITAEDLAF